MNNLVKKWVAAAAHTPIYLGVLAVCLVFVSGVYYNLNVPFSFYAFVFLATLTVYLLDRLVSVIPDAENQPERANYFKKNRPYLWTLVIIAFPLVLSFGFFYNLRFFLMCGFLCCLCALYLYLFSLLHKKSLAGSVAFLKPLLIALVWSSVTLVLPFSVDENTALPFSVWPLFAFRALLYFSNGVLFDIRDFEGDRKNKKLNFAVYIGLAKARILFVAILLAELIVLAVWAFPGDFTWFVGGELLSALLLFTFFRMMPVDKEGMYKGNVANFAYIADGILITPVLWLPVGLYLNLLQAV